MATCWKRSILLSGLCVALLGCGGESGPPRYHVSGEVTYDDAPIPYGEVVFEPDSAASNTGPSTRVVIENGVFTTKTKGGKGAISGPMIVRITGFDGASDSGTQPHGAPLFKEYVEKLELPAEESTQTFNVLPDK